MRKIYISCFMGLCCLTTLVKAEEKGTSAEEMDVDITLTPEQRKKAEDAFIDIYAVLQHPRCLNCHPNGDRPLQGDNSQPHAMNISRESITAGLQCAACHQTQNSEAYGIEGGPPGAPNWHLPEKDMPLIFEGRNPGQLCLQLKDPNENGHKSLEQIYEHIAYDPLVLWGWDPGGNRLKPPVSHADFTKQFRLWIDLGAPCPSTP